ncbi:Hypothetical protein A7982_07653 [Minicystis rosea]|nr:Hypothetical protein A7982_07653 [Minicystis rosea]
MLTDLGDNFPIGIAIDETHVYYTPISGPNAVERVLKVGGPVEAVAITEPTGQRNLAVDEEYAYFSSIKGGIWRAPKAGGPVTLLGWANKGAAFMASDGDALYAEDAFGWSVARFPIDGSPEVKLYSATSGGAGHMVLDDDTVYWVDMASTSYNKPHTVVHSVPKVGGAHMDVAVLPPGVANYGTGLAVDDRCVYWGELASDGTGGRVRKTAKK